MHVTRVARVRTGKESSTTANASLIPERKKIIVTGAGVLLKPSNPETEPNAAMSFFRITLHRSAIGLPERTRGVLAALGLRRRMQTVFHPVEPQFAGMILKVKELVRVREVDAPLSKAQVKAARTPDSGFYVERAVPRM
ncbi:54S ribosomal protein L33, mitochondrial [Tolypocladium capitatum]|uniref:Large ribosomal subunit protein uL30m n=1 Tax=Tolypocladium capitatum TaxID=45235 RepID=A0A2K3QEY3_9HYPO|nr:54S ribosomal protein L33, mitochondrial [Tolypocladium capitatum]